MQPEHYEAIGRKLVYKFLFTEDKEETGYIDSDSEYFNLINS